jgi:hypothetical protein
MMKHAVISLTAVLFLTAACGKKEEAKKSAEPLVAVAKEAVLPASKVRELVTGNTIYAVSAAGGETHKIFNAKNGSVMSVEGYGRKGKWRATDDGRYCLEWEGKPENCWSIAKDSKGGYVVVNKDQLPVWVLTKVQPGRP